MKYTCLSCGVDLNLANTYRENYRYCKECGPKIKDGVTPVNEAKVEEPNKPSTAMSFCPSCGNKLPDDCKFCPQCGKQVLNSQIANEPIMTAEGSGTTLVLYNNKLTIKRHEGIGNLILHGIKGDKDIYLKQISAIQFKKPGGWTKGYIQFAFIGGREAKRGIFEATQDENTVMFDDDQAPQFEAMKQAIESKL